MVPSAMLAATARREDEAGFCRWSVQEYMSGDAHIWLGSEAMSANGRGKDEGGRARRPHVWRRE